MFSALVSYLAILGTILFLLSTAFPLPLRAQTNANDGNATNNIAAASTNETPDVRISGTGINVGGRNPVDINVPTEWHHEHGVDVVGLVAVVAGCSVPVAIVMVFSYFNHRRNKMLHETLRAMVEKGVPIPPELISNQMSAREGQAGRPRNDLRNGLILAGVGIGVVMLAGKAGWIILFVGVAFLIASMVENRNKNDTQPPK
jgi:Domain of unknown function (DUF6249)